MSNAPQGRGNASQGHAPQGHEPRGNASQGNDSRGNQQGRDQQGRQGREQQGNAPQGQDSRGDAPQGNGAPEIGSGYLEISEKGFGFLAFVRPSLLAQGHRHFRHARHDQEELPARRRAGGRRAEPAAPRHQSPAQDGREGERDDVPGLHEGPALREPDHH